MQTPKEKTHVFKVGGPDFRSGYTFTPDRSVWCSTQMPNHCRPTILLNRIFNERSF